MYQKDQETETDRVARMKAAGSDASDIKHAVRPLQCSDIWYDETFFARTTTQNFFTCCHVLLQEQVLAEAAMMVPDTRQRLETALADLQQCLVSRPKLLCFIANM